MGDDGMRINDLKAVDIMSKEPITIGCEVELSEVLGHMRNNNIHEIPVVTGKKLLGIASYDMLMKRRNIPLTTKVEKIMTLPPRITEEESLPEIAEALMVGGHRALPVTTDDTMLGIVSRTDVVKAMRELDELKGLKVEKIMTPNPHCIKENASILEARNLMKSLDERSIPVVDDNGRLTGVIGVKDLVDSFTKVKDSQKTRVTRRLKNRELDIEVKGIMRRPPISVGKQNDVRKAVDLMVRNEISSVMVAEDGKPIGILTQADLIELLASFRESPQLYVQITGLEEDSEFFDVLYSIIRKNMKRISKIENPKILNLHVVQHHHDGLRSKFTLRARMTTDRKMYYTKAFEWDILKALDEVMKQLEKTIKKEKERRVGARKYKKKV
jgi:CBS domain-containing protein/ribosome-associated translation inhibitor RaiA